LRGNLGTPISQTLEAKDHAEEGRNLSEEKPGAPEGHPQADGGGKNRDTRPHTKLNTITSVRSSASSRIGRLEGCVGAGGLPSTTRALQLVLGPSPSAPRKSQKKKKTQRLKPHKDFLGMGQGKGRSIQESLEQEHRPNPPRRNLPRDCTTLGFHKDWDGRRGQPSETPQEFSAETRGKGGGYRASGREGSTLFPGG